VTKRDTWKGKSYLVPPSWFAGGELGLAAYGAVVILMALIKRSFLLIPNIAIQTLGFLYVSALTIQQSFFDLREE